MNKYILGLVMLLASFAYGQDSTFNIKKNELVLEVNGMVCAMCAFGVQEGLSKLSFLDKKKFKADGVEVDLDSQMIYIPIDLSKKVDEFEAMQLVKDAGYDTIAIYTNYDSKGIKKKSVPKLAS
jgi:copper chaperone CopZ|tara:strand:- start:927 stop:1298 length:372 start_codon:yes stop_codon:yes gene_type:complete